MRPSPVTLVSGSASGIGAATVRALTAAGHRVIGCDLRDADIVGDLSDAIGRNKIIEAGLQRCAGKLDGLVLCAGLGPESASSPRVVSVNYFGAVALLDGFLPALRQGHHPAAVVVSSLVSAFLPWTQNPLAAALEANNEEQARALVDEAGVESGNLAYRGSKNALTVAIRKRAVVWGQAGVRLNAVAPGITMTPMVQAGLADARFRDAIQGALSPLGRHADPSEVAAVIAFLMGPAATYVHGAQLFVDGGLDASVRPTSF